MAVWQFKFSLVPVDGMRRVHEGDVAILQAHQTTPDGPKVIDDTDIVNYWDSPMTLQQVALDVSRILPEMKSWSQDARMFGQGDSNKIEVWDDDVACFVDMRYFSEEFLRKVIDIANKFKCKLSIHGSGVVIEPDMATIINQIVDSNAYKFCVNPRDYLRKI